MRLHYLEIVRTDVENVCTLYSTTHGVTFGIALPPMSIPGHGTCAIVFQGGIEAGLWQV